ncbi:hypothetical protein ESA94_17460 [Lacibacter luteus]|uniref:Glycosyltransferase RgtA/B/C/D-like domain-containing protein n=1 Tax=Lacibacter luteus TaxID=2508719 RepID=A0A4Q1CEZ2_9BACT|nr:hypothetical protein [Lacibacter luteus]RXK58425.1 hypothetical protein ESA94_17460 [Lacibacter luteus]
MNTPKQLYIATGIAILVSFFIYYPVFFTDYAFTDEAHQLWNNKDGSNFTIFLNHGRIITGWLFDAAFANIQSVGDIKWLRMFSFASLLVFILVYAVYGRKLFKQLGLPAELWWLSVVFIPCSLSAAIYIGWASCAEIFFATTTAFLSGYILFTKLNSSEQYIQIPTGTLVMSVVFALSSLFTYQTAFGFFLFPFFLYFISKKAAKTDRTVVIGIVFYLACYVLYYLLFKYSLKVYNVTASERTAINIDPLGKLSFFFSYPLAQAFSFNFLYNARSIVSQLFYPAMLVLWMLSLYWQNNKKQVGKILLHVAFCIGFFVLMYLPLMISLENFASYRTMFAFNFAAFVILCYSLLTFFKSEPIIRWVTVTASLILTVTAFYNYHYNFSKPLAMEYQTLRNVFLTAYKEGDSVLLKRPPVNAFKPLYGINYYTDEFGYPSTEKDWTADPLLKQLLLEKTGSREKAGRLIVLQYAHADSVQFNEKRRAFSGLVIDMEQLMMKNNAE